MPGPKIGWRRSRPAISSTRSSRSTRPNWQRRSPTHAGPRKRRTRQLEQVFAALQGDHSHPFAHEIYRRVRQKLPRISLGTVYRNLHSLVEEGKIRTLLLDGQAARYDPETSEHDHFVCEG